ncbi:hypothetical protein [Mycolicibacterium sp.]|uniref:hypothetical protein n=1 Tax=Mycolicibacterium sp. TaxID=2320850 RepID=UPI00355FB5CB
MRLLWTLITPRRLRRYTLGALVVWAVLAFTHHSGVFADVPAVQLPRPVSVQ